MTSLRREAYRLCLCADLLPASRNKLQFSLTKIEDMHMHTDSQIYVQHAAVKYYCNLPSRKVVSSHSTRIRLFIC